MAIDKDAVTVSPREQPPPNNSNDDASYKRDPVSLSGGHSPSTLPPTQAGGARAPNVPRPAILKKNHPPAAESGGILREVTVGTNTETASPLLHGEIQTIQQFYGMPKAEGRPDAKDTVFFATHEPCSLCESCFLTYVLWRTASVLKPVWDSGVLLDAMKLTAYPAGKTGLSGITWGGWDKFFYLLTYEDTRDAFSIPHDIRILEEVSVSSLALSPSLSRSDSSRSLFLIPLLVHETAGKQIPSPLNLRARNRFRPLLAPVVPRPQRLLLVLLVRRAARHDPGF